MSKSLTQKGNALLVVVLLAAAVGAGGYYLKSSGKLNLGQKSSHDTNTESGYILATPKSSSADSESDDSSVAVSTSDKLTLSLTSPQNGVVVKSGSVVVSGKTAPNAEVFINDRSVKADASGNFSLTLMLDEGENSLVVTANNEDGDVVEQTVSVNVQTF